ncbi:hypothetical protein [Xanthobacter tagetidis]|nr:hypothetical protein [Xanthobacter tagetidis]MBB6306513.1 hypothetical protein [Xanthobacter tagetidis]
MTGKPTRHEISYYSTLGMQLLPTGMLVNFLATLALLLLVFFWIGAYRLARGGNAISGVLVAAGSLGFFGVALVPAAGPWLQHIELPAIFWVTSISGPANKTFTTTAPLARIQRYGADGRFECGWFANTGGGVFAIGLTQDGQIAVASLRTKQVEFFNPDGSQASAPRPYTGTDAATGGVLRPSDIRVEGVSFVETSPGAHPSPRWTTLAMVPFLDPFIAWLLMALGGFWAYRKRRLSRQDAPSPRP